MADVFGTSRPSIFGQVQCDKCGHELGRWDGQKFKLRIEHKSLVIGADGRCSTLCPECHQIAYLPLKFVFVVLEQGTPALEVLDGSEIIS